MTLVFACRSAAGQTVEIYQAVITAELPDESDSILTSGIMSTITPTASQTLPPEENYLVAVPGFIPHLFSEPIQSLELASTVPFTLSICEDATDSLWFGEYIFAAAVQFPSVADIVSKETIEHLWSGDMTEDGQYSMLIVPEEHKPLFTTLWGTPDSNKVQLLTVEEIPQKLWDDPTYIAILPFESITPHMKVLSINGQHPMWKNFESSMYPMTVIFCLKPDGEVSGEEKLGNVPVTNRDEAKMTTVLMTGVTALTRETAYVMEQEGILKPGEQILDWFEAADLVHISNEVPFTAECPVPMPPFSASRFCSRPAYFDLLESIGVDVIELTGNHLLDYGEDAFQETLAQLSSSGIQYYGGGSDLADASNPLLIEMNGNRFAFLGCNVPGPDSVFADSSNGGANPCNMEALIEDVSSLSRQGYQVIVTFQHYEACQVQPMSLQKLDMISVAQAGATIVSGSQAHCPQAMTFFGDSFVHYGLGNLFFDQMWDVYRNAFLDYHVFYDGRYLGVQLLTTRLENASQPRPMTDSERTEFLTDIFSQCEWGIHEEH